MYNSGRAGAIPLVVEGASGGEMICRWLSRRITVRAVTRTRAAAGGPPPEWNELPASRQRAIADSKALKRYRANPTPFNEGALKAEVRAQFSSGVDRARYPSIEDSVWPLLRDWLGAVDFAAPAGEVLMVDAARASGPAAAGPAPGAPGAPWVVVSFPGHPSAPDFVSLCNVLSDFMPALHAAAGRSFAPVSVWTAQSQVRAGQVAVRVRGAPTDPKAAWWALLTVAHEVGHLRDETLDGNREDGADDFAARWLRDHWAAIADSVATHFGQRVVLRQADLMRRYGDPKPGSAHAPGDVRNQRLADILADVAPA